MVGGGALRIIFTHELEPLSPDLKFTESIWDVLEETLQSAWLLHCQYKILNKTMMYLLMEITSQHLFLYSVKSTPAHPKDFQWIEGLDSEVAVHVW